jgi:hypothetical protein
MKKTLFGAALLATTAFGILQASTAFAQTKPPKDVFTTKAAAETRATQLKCKGVHGSGTAWTPCKDAASYTAAIKKMK